MSTSVSKCAAILSGDGVRHHVDQAEGAIRLAFVTKRYRNLRGEKLALVRIETPDDGHRCRVSIERAFTPGLNAALTCLDLCRLAADTPLVSVEYAEDFENLRMTVENVVEDGELTRLQLLSMVDRIVEAAECWQTALESTTSRSSRGRRRRGSPLPGRDSDEQDAA
ncbi:MAG: hypothetical protein K8S94_17205 [Planctomycetia bacterium]|nr:hypothetical protein [Planctomycetia bacterium]